MVSFTWRVLIMLLSFSEKIVFMAYLKSEVHQLRLYSTRALIDSTVWFLRIS